MALKDFNPISEGIKNVSEAVKNFYEVIDGILQPRGIDLAIQNAHIKIIEQHIAREDLDEEAKIAFVCSYKKTIKEYRNICTVVKGAANNISDNAKPHEVDEDWFVFFFDKVRLISNESFQVLWSRILANEVNCPGKYSRALLHTLSIMDSSQAADFCNLSKFCMYEYGNEQIVHPLIFISDNRQEYETENLSRTQLAEFERLGLVLCDFKGEFTFYKKKVFRYGNHVIAVYGDPNAGQKIYAGNVHFTNNGLALFSIVGDEFKQYDSAVLDSFITKFQQRNCEVIVNNKKFE